MTVVGSVKEVLSAGVSNVLAAEGATGGSAANTDALKVSIRVEASSLVIEDSS
jgi:hypothetical protein